MALLFEDISAEISLTRRLRAQIDRCYDAFFALDDAVANFASNGELVFLNAAHKELWRDEAETTVFGDNCHRSDPSLVQVCRPDPRCGPTFATSCCKAKTAASGRPL